MKKHLSEDLLDLLKNCEYSTISYMEQNDKINALYHELMLKRYIIMKPHITEGGIKEAHFFITDLGKKYLESIEN
jgi:hypothetical protein